MSVPPIGGWDEHGCCEREGRSPDERLRTGGPCSARPSGEGVAAVASSEERGVPESSLGGPAGPAAAVEES